MDKLAMYSMEDSDGWSIPKGAEKTGLQAGKGARRLMPAHTEGTVVMSSKSGGKFRGAPVEGHIFCKNMLGVFVQS